jgi:hypothetical protein
LYRTGKRGYAKKIVYREALSNCGAFSRFDPEWSPPPVDGEVGEVIRHTPGGTPDASGDEDHLSGAQRVLFALHLDSPRARHPHKDDVYFVVDVLPDAPPDAETHHVGVQVITLF